MVQKMQLLGWYGATHHAGIETDRPCATEAKMKLIDLLLSWRRRRQDRELLRAMSDRELCDLGIGRGEIPALLQKGGPAQ
jgi:uncharacterized protein YjiS (DUF1127 family)